MASEETIRTESGRYDQIGSSSVVSLAAAGSDASRMLEELRVENAGLRRLVAELLVANQQLRERYGFGRREGEGAASPAASRAKEWVDRSSGRRDLLGDLADSR
jgi:hypothetical protein